MNLPHGIEIHCSSAESILSISLVAVVLGSCFPMSSIYLRLRDEHS